MDETNNKLNGENPNIEVIKKEKNIFHHGENIKYFRCKRKWKQEYFAALIGVTQQAVSEWELKEELSDEILEKAGKALEIGVAFLKENPFIEDSGNPVIHQHGNHSAAFSGNDKVDYKIENPIGELKDAYNNSLEYMKEALQIVTENCSSMKGVYDDSLQRIEDKNLSIIADLKEENKAIKEENKDLRTELGQIYINKIKE